MASKTSFTDYELVRAIHLDNKEVLDYLFETNYVEIRKFISDNGGTDAQAANALQQAIVELWYHINHQHFKPEKDLKTYLFNLVKQSWGKDKNENAFYNSLTDSGNKLYDLNVVSNCVGILEPQQRNLLCYHYFEGYDLPRMAVILNLEDKNLAEFKFNEAKKQLQALLQIRYPEIEKEKDLEKVISSGVSAYRYKELMSFMKDNAVVPTEEKSINLAWVLVIVIVLIVGGVGTWIYSNNFSFGDKEKKENINVPKADTLDEAAKKNIPKEKDIKTQQKRINQTIKDIDSMEYATMDTGKVMDEDVQIPKGKIQQVNSKGDIVIKEILDTAGNGDIVVRKDELLFTMYCKVLEKSGAWDTLGDEKSKDNASSTSKTAELLNPQAKLPKEEQKIKVYQVELWKSPVNYKGYKMQKNKIIIYGIEDTEQIELVSFDETIYLHTGPNFYMLIPSIDFRSFVKLKDKAILHELTK